MLPRKQFDRSPSPENSPLVHTIQSLSLNGPLKLTTKPPLAESHSPVSKAPNQIATVIGSKSDGQFNTLPRYSRPKTYSKGSDKLPQLGRISIRTLRPKSQSPTRSHSYEGDRHGDSDKMYDMPAVSPQAVKPRGHRREPSWIQVSMTSPLLL